MTAFLESEFPRQSPEALFHILPVPYEGTVSYGAGTSGGPDAILAASQQLEAFDGIDIPGEAGLFTHPPLACAADMGPQAVASQVERRFRELLTAGKTPIMLGGEHSITFGAVCAAAEAMDIGVVQFDAHADLRDQYDGTPYSHACVMRRVAELGIPIFQIGVRSLSHEEHTFIQSAEIPCLTAADLYRNALPEQVLPVHFPERIYVTFDVDAFDPSLMPATGTPEPGGLFWHDALTLLATISRERKIIGCDIVELAPIKGFHAPDYAVARLAYRIMGLIRRRTTPETGA